MSCLKMLKRMRIEPFIFLYMFSAALKGLTIAQLVQDKICLFKYGLSAAYCDKLSGEVSGGTEVDFKNKVLADVTTFSLYHTLITTIPLIFWSMFLGAWADRHLNAPKILMSISSIAAIAENVIFLLNAIYFEKDANLMLIAFVPASLTGGILGIMMSVYSYISSTTEPKSRTIRFTILEALIFVATPIGIFIGGELIGKTIEGTAGQLHQYSYVFIVCIAAQVLASVWIIFIPFEESIYPKESQIKQIDTNENIKQIMYETEDNSQIEIAEDLINGNEETKPLIKKGQDNQDNFQQTLNKLRFPQKIRTEMINSSTHQILSIEAVMEQSIDESTKESIESSHWYDMFGDLFDIQNIKDMFNTCTKPRSGGKRAEIWILILSLTLIALTHNGTSGIMFQYVQRVFSWDAKIYSLINASTLLITSFSVIVIVPILVKVLRFTDMSLSIVGIFSVFIQNLIRGTILNANAFYVSYIFGSLAYIPPISVRSKLSTIVEHDEENKVFGLLATLETMTPFVSSIIYTSIFTASIATYPGLVFQISTAILFLPFLGFVYVALYCD